MKLITSTIVLLLSTACSTLQANTPVCSGPENWPASMGYVKLKNAEVMAAPIAPKKTKASLIMNEKIGADLYRQLHKIEYVDTKGNHYGVLTISDASSEECSMSEVQVFIIKEVL